MSDTNDKPPSPAERKKPALARLDAEELKQRAEREIEALNELQRRRRTRETSTPMGESIADLFDAIEPPESTDAG